MMSKANTTNFEDIMQVVVGASALSVPIAFTEEAWDLGRTLPVLNLVLIVVLSLLFINLYSLHSIFQRDIRNRVSAFLVRTVVDYGVTLSVVFVVLFALNRLPILAEPAVAIKRILILSFPASMGAVVVDSLDKE
jgi:uncharacterized membrane protein